LYFDGAHTQEKSETHIKREVKRQNAAQKADECIQTLEDRFRNKGRIRKQLYINFGKALKEAYRWTLGGRLRDFKRSIPPPPPSPKSSRPRSRTSESTNVAGATIVTDLTSDQNPDMDSDENFDQDTLEDAE
jgi:hypothetical protein